MKRALKIESESKGGVLNASLSALWGILRKCSPTVTSQVSYGTGTAVAGGSCAVQNFVLYKHWESMRTHKNNNEAHHSNRECAFYLKGKE
jgi:hypothetical protein